MKTAQITNVLILTFLLTLETLAFKVPQAMGQGSSQPSPALAARPYGTILLNLFYNNGAVNNLDIPLFALPTEGEDTQSMTARQSRFGLLLTLPDPLKALLSAKAVTAKVEADFFGGLSDSAVGVTKPLPRMRLAYATLEWEHTKLTVGQDWMIFSPLNPTTLAHQSIVGFATSGNLWERAPQIKADCNVARGNLSFGGALGVIAPEDVEFFNADLSEGTKNFTVTRPPAKSLADPVALSKTPGLQGRIFAGYKMPSGKPALLGLSGHVHQERYPLNGDKEKNVDAFAVSADLSLPLLSWLSLQGEFFSGKNLDSFMGGIWQGIRKTLDDTTKALTDVEEIRSIGGWGQVSLTPISWLSIHLAGGIDDPDDKDLGSKARAKNFTLYGAVVATLVERFKVGIEYDRIETSYVPDPAVQNQDNTQTSHHINFGALYEF